jgi:hypothetical protein
MKKIYATIVSVMLVMGLSAQDNQVSIGADIGLPIGDFGDAASLLIGPSAGFELPVGDNLGVTVQVGYSIAMLKDDVSDIIANWSLIPAQAGLKYYFSESQAGAYGHAQIGIHASSVKTEDIDLGPLGTIEGETTSNTDLSWAIGAGYMLEKFDIGLRYNTITSSEDGVDASSYIGLRIAYLIPLGG